MRRDNAGMLEVVVVGGVILVLFVLNWIFVWRRDDPDANRGLQTWQGWDDGHGGGT